VKRLPLWIAIASAVVAGSGLTAFAEATWYAVRRHIDFAEVLGANIDPDSFPTPTAYVAAAGLIVLVIYAARSLQARRASRVLAAAE
jgi:uncharacterized integral membrane protein